MKRIECMMVPVNFSRCSQAALEYALVLAKSLQARIEVVHVIDPSLGPPRDCFAYPAAPFDVTGRPIDALQRWVDAMRRQGVEAEPRVVCGVPFVEIVKVAEAGAADLIVMGTPESADWLSVTVERVIQRAPCPVVTVRARHHRWAPPEREDLTDERVLLA
jgi:nucleotide-binding universal stress UspA family protein